MKSASAAASAGPCKRRYRFIGRAYLASGQPYYIWHAVVPGDSRVEEVKCTVAYFWAK